MLLLNYKIFKYRLPLKNLTNREGLLLEVFSDQKSYGEIAPLSGFSKEDIGSILQILPSLLDPLIDKELTAFPKNINSPAISFGLETALFPLLYKISPLVTPPLGILLSGTSNDILTKAKKTQGYSTYKLKLKNISREKSIELIIKLKSILNNAPLRLDFNQSWSLVDILHLRKHFSPSDFSYLEEPVANFNDIVEISKKTRFNIALDESLSTTPIHLLDHIPTLKALILKPTLLGGYTKLSKWIEYAKQHKLQAVLSSSYESEVGIKSIIQMANYFNLTDTPIGLDTLDVFEKTNPFPFLEPIQLCNI